MEAVEAVNFYPEFLLSTRLRGRYALSESGNRTRYLEKVSMHDPEARITVEIGDHGLTGLHGLGPLRPLQATWLRKGRTLTETTPNFDTCTKVNKPANDCWDGLQMVRGHGRPTQSHGWPRVTLRVPL